MTEVRQLMTWPLSVPAGESVLSGTALPTSSVSEFVRMHQRLASTSSLLYSISDEVFHAVVRHAFVSWFGTSILSTSGSARVAEWFGTSPWHSSACPLRSNFQAQNIVLVRRSTTSCFELVFWRRVSYHESTTSSMSSVFLID